MILHSWDSAAALRCHQALPEGFLDADARDLHAMLGGPTLIELGGRRSPALFVSVLLHGNEVTGLLAIQEVLRRFHDQGLPRDLCLFVGNTAAAARGVRHLDGQPDFNRIWPGTEATGSPEAQLLGAVWDRMRRRGLFASIDVHNNTGINPHYGCVNRLDRRYLSLAALFSRTVVYFTRPAGVQSLAFAELAPAVTVECGRPGEPHGVERAAEFLEAALRLSSIPEQGPVPAGLDVYHTVARVRVPDWQPIELIADGESVAEARARCPADGRSALLLRPNIDACNFRELPAGTMLAHLDADEAAEVPLLVEDEAGRNVVERYFRLHGGELQLNRAMMPSMLTRDLRVIRQDCLCYLMERLDAQAIEHAR